MGSAQTVWCTFQYEPGLHALEAAKATKVGLTLVDVKRRHDAQYRKLESVKQFVQFDDTLVPGADPLLDQCACYKVMVKGEDDTEIETQQIKFYNGEPAFQNILYLFNVIVAFEWKPSAMSCQQIRHALKQASDFLFDVTNGYMAIGKVIIGGSDLMDVADIQVMASNRIHPRSWMTSLNEMRKYKPIRVGRGLWQKNHDSMLSWNNPEGYRALVHEWGHYAFGLRDDYLSSVEVTRTSTSARFWEQSDGEAGWKTENALTLVAPDVALVAETLMANTQISEYAYLSTTFDRIREYYALVEGDKHPLEGPPFLSTSLPHIVELKQQASAFQRPNYNRVVIDPSTTEDALINIKPAVEQARSIAGYERSSAEAHWLYLLKQPYDREGVPARMIAQGKLGARDELDGTIRLLGAVADDQLVMVSQVSDRVVVQRVILTKDSSDSAHLQAKSWEDTTPPGLTPNTSLFVDVIPDTLASPESNSLPMQADLRVRVEAPDRPDSVYVYSTGSHDGQHAQWTEQGIITKPVCVPHLDGHVLVRWAPTESHEERLFICAYSQGGGPNTSSGGTLPITGGSSDGNAMIFFNDNISDSRKPSARNPVDTKKAETLRLVTTTITAGQQRIGRNTETRSYCFSVACNDSLRDYKAALMLQYDSAAPRRGSDLLIYRWNRDNNTWQRLTTFVRPDLPYVTVPIGVLDDNAKTPLETAPALTAQSEDIRVERYRIFLTPVE